MIVLVEKAMPTCPSHMQPNMPFPNLEVYECSYKMCIKGSSKLHTKTIKLGKVVSMEFEKI